jgi:hypothetical protein
MGTPSLVLRGDRLFAFEMYNLDNDPAEKDNLLAAEDAGMDALLASEWVSALTVPLGDKVDDAEVDLPTMLDGAERVSVY